METNADELLSDSDIVLSQYVPRVAAVSEKPKSSSASPALHSRAFELKVQSPQTLTPSSLRMPNKQSGNSALPGFEALDLETADLPVMDANATIMTQNVAPYRAKCVEGVAAGLLAARLSSSVLTNTLPPAQPIWWRWSSNLQAALLAHAISHSLLAPTGATAATSAVFSGFTTSAINGARLQERIKSLAASTDALPPLIVRNILELDKNNVHLDADNVALDQKSAGGNTYLSSKEMQELYDWAVRLMSLSVQRDQLAALWPPGLTDAWTQSKWVPAAAPAFASAFTSTATGSSSPMYSSFSSSYNAFSSSDLSAFSSSTSTAPTGSSGTSTSAFVPDGLLKERQQQLQQQREAEAAGQGRLNPWRQVLVARAFLRMLVAQILIVEGVVAAPLSSQYQTLQRVNPAWPRTLSSVSQSLWSFPSALVTASARSGGTGVLDASTRHKNKVRGWKAIAQFL